MVEFGSSVSHFFSPFVSSSVFFFVLTTSSVLGTSTVQDTPANDFTVEFYITDTEIAGVKTRLGV